MYMYAEPLDLCVGNVTVGYINAYTANTLGLLQGAKSKRADNVLIVSCPRVAASCKCNRKPLGSLRGCCVVYPGCEAPS
jgi:hypothetical protein